MTNYSDIVLKLQDKITGYYSYSFNELLPNEYSGGDSRTTIRIIGLITESEGDFVRCDDDEVYPYYIAQKMRQNYLDGQPKG